MACGARDDGLSPSCTAQLVFVSFMAGIQEADAAPDVQHGQTGSVILTIQCLVNARVLLAGPRRHLACGLRAGALGPSCTAQLVFVSFMVGSSEVGTAPDVHRGQKRSVILTIQWLLTACVLLAGPRRPLACGLSGWRPGPELHCSASVCIVHGGYL